MKKLFELEKTPSVEAQTWPIDKLIFYARNPRKNDAAVDRMCGSIREFGFKIPCLARSDGEVIESDPPRKLVQTWRMTMTPDFLLVDSSCSRSGSGISSMLPVIDLGGGRLLPVVASLLTCWIVKPSLWLWSVTCTL